MTPYEFGQALAQLMGRPLHPEALATRNLHIALLRANYGEPSAVMFAWEGSGPWLQSYMTLRGHSDDIDLIVGGEAVTQKHTKKQLHQLIMKFIDKAGVTSQTMNQIIPPHGIFTELESQQ